MLNTTTDTAPTITRIIKTSETGLYTSGTLHLEVVNSTGKTLHPLPIVVDSTTTVPGLITFNSIPLVVGTNKCKILLSNVLDIDTGVATLTTLGSISIKVVTTTSVFSV